MVQELDSVFVTLVWASLPPVSTEFSSSDFSRM